ncbi:MAG: hypothetical protein C0608_06200 [Deltaproteobacteria bacterium]|nr:MAG: hypothetical protein C0608_06200 [Deltaproteobacteria bacterium]
MIQQKPDAIVAFTPPDDYRPFANVEVCGIKGRNVEYIVEAEGFPPVLIGMGEAPLVWMAQVTEEPDAPWRWVVNQGVSASSAIRVLANTEEHSVLVKKRSVPLLAAYIEQGGKLVVTHLDMRPLGINIYSDDGHFYAGDAKMDNCVYINVRSMFEIGPPPAKRLA